MPPTPDRFDTLATSVDDIELEQRRDAARSLSQALTTADIRSLITARRTPTPAVTVALLPNDGERESASADPNHALPVRSRVADLQQALRALSIEAEIRSDSVGPEPAVKIELATSQDARRLAAWVTEHLPPPLAAAHRLRTALANVGINATGVRAAGALVSIGDISAQEATQLSVLLQDIPQSTDSDAGWHALEQLASRTAAILSATAGRYVTAVADQACTTCARSRPHRIRVGSLPLPETHRLAEALEKAGTPENAAPN